MKRILKTLLLWLLVTAVPLQAVASAAGMSCAPAHHAAATALAEDMSHQGHDDASGHHHDGATPADVASDAVSAKASALGDVHDTCSFCSPFCSGAVAPPSVFLDVPTLGGAETTVAAPAPALAGFIPDGLRRPPKSLS